MKTLILLAIFLVCIITMNCSNSDKECAMKSLESNQLKLKSFKQDIDSMTDIKNACYRKIQIIFGDTLKHSVVTRINSACRNKEIENKETKHANLSPTQKDSLKLIFKQLNNTEKKITVCNDSVKQIKIRIDELNTAYNTIK